jgi:hypothetical protein
MFSIMRLFLCTLLCASASNAQVRVDQKIIEFGVVKAGDAHTAIVTLTNTGPKPIDVQRAEVSCVRCTFVQMTPATLAPGEKLKASVRFAPPIGESGLVQRDVAFITSDSPLLPPKVWLQAYITNTVGWWPAELICREPLKPATHIQKMIELVNVSNEPISFGLISQPTDSPHIVLPKMLKPGETVDVPLTWDLPAKPGEYTGMITVQVPHDDAKMAFAYYAKVQNSP